MRPASLFAVAVLVVVAVALPIQSAFAALTLDINPNPVVLGGSITFSGTGATPGVQFDVAIWPDQCAGSPQTGVTGNADNSGNYQIVFDTSNPINRLMVAGQYVARTAYPGATSPCVAFTVIEPFTGILVAKATTNGDTTTVFPFLASGPAFYLRGGEYMLSTQIPAGDYEFTEVPLDGWVLYRISCEGAPINPHSTFEFMPGVGVTIHYVAGDEVTCTFTNCPLEDCPLPVTAPVGGVVIPANTLALVAPWLAVLSLLYIGTIAVVVKKRR